MNYLLILYIWTILLWPLTNGRVQKVGKFVEVKVKEGFLRGVIDQTPTMEPYFKFEGIPYAKPPVNELRFKAPQQIEQWSDVLNATKSKTVCIQMSRQSEDVIGSEDCLYLNIYSKLDDKDKNNLKSVMIWIHGGAFKFGGIEDHISGPELLISEDVLLVKIQYRLNVFGFLSVPDPSAGIPGNAGMKDQVMAIKWVKNNIKEFGGDPERITLFGVSAGGASTHLHYVSPMTAGLMNGVISQSGAANNPWVGTSKNYFNDYAEKIKCQNGDLNQIVDCMREYSAKELLVAQEELTKLTTFDNGETTIFGVVVEENSMEEAFLPEPVDVIIEKGTFNQVSFITGYLPEDGFAGYSKSGLYLQNDDLLIPKEIKISRGTEESKKLGKQIREFYWGDSSPNDFLEHFIQYETDNLFLIQMYRNVKKQVARSSQPIYFYKFEYYTPLNEFYNVNPYKKKSPDLSKPVVSHVDDCHYLFTFARTPKDFVPESDIHVGIRRMVSLWTSFAKTGNPNPNSNNENDSHLSAKWDPVTEETINYLYITPNLTQAINPEKERMEFWDKFYSENQP